MLHSPHSLASVILIFLIGGVMSGITFFSALVFGRRQAHVIVYSHTEIAEITERDLSHTDVLRPDGSKRPKVERTDHTDILS